MLTTAVPLDAGAPGKRRAASLPSMPDERVDGALGEVALPGVPYVHDKGSWQVSDLVVLEPDSKVRAKFCRKCGEHKILMNSDCASNSGLLVLKVINSRHCGTIRRCVAETG